VLRQRGITISILLAALVLTGCGAAARPEPIADPAPESQPSDSAELGGAYLGQRLPGSLPEFFAPGIVTGDLHTPPVFTPDGSQAYWSLQDNTILTSALENGSWTEPATVAFSESMTDYRDPFISPSGDKLFFLSKGKLPGSQLPEKESIWFVERSGQGWGEPQPLSEKVNALTLHWQISVAANGNLYFSSSEPDGIGDIYVSKNRADEYGKPVKLAAPISTEQVELTPYVAPDESYLIFARMADQNGDPMLYISFADGNGGWDKPVLVETVTYGLCPSVSPDGKYVFYLSSPQSVSWMNTDFIDELRPGQ
jgi:hypothetical protein